MVSTVQLARILVGISLNLPHPSETAFAGFGVGALRSTENISLIILKSPFNFEPNSVTQIEQTVYLQLDSRLLFSDNKNIPDNGS